METKAMAALTLDTLRLQRDMLERMADKALADAIAAQMWGDDVMAAEYLGLRTSIRASLAEVRAKISQTVEVL